MIQRQKNLLRRLSEATRKRTEVDQIIEQTEQQLLVQAINIRMDRCLNKEELRGLLQLRDSLRILLPGFLEINLERLADSDELKEYVKSQQFSLEIHLP